jgi:hypothetical protein
MRAAVMRNWELRVDALDAIAKILVEPAPT